MSVKTGVQPYGISTYGFVRIAAVTPTLQIADPNFNATKIIELTNRCFDLEASVILFPELSLTGYSCEDLFHSSDLLKESQRALARVLAETQEMSNLLVFGLPVQATDDRLYNCALIAQAGRVLGVVPKVHLANYGEFYEKRWFASGQDVDCILPEMSARLNPYQVFCAPIGEYRLKIGVDVCEDLWVPDPKSTGLALAGANLILNLSASNDYVSKSAYRRALVEQQSARLLCAYGYSCSGVFESSKDIVFCGHSLIAENGQTLAEGRRFSFDDEITLADIDIDKLEHERRHNTSFQTQRSSSVIWREAAPLHPLKSLQRKIDPTPFVPSDPAVLNERMDEIIQIQSSGLARRLLGAKAQTALVGISGGLDSTLAMLVTVAAFERIGRPRQEIHGVSMPGPGTSERTRDSARSLASALGISFREIDINDSVQIHFRDIGHDPGKFDIVYENTQARLRMLILMDLANALRGLVVGTGNMTELALGWCTYNGDHMSHYNVNVAVPKTLVRFLVRWYSSHHADPRLSSVLDTILETQISPELLPLSSEGEITQRTEEILGPIEVHDFVLFHFVRNGFQREKILFLAKEAFSKTHKESDIEKWVALFFKRFHGNQFKRSCVPPGPKVGSVTLSPRGDWRMPDETEA